MNKSNLLVYTSLVVIVISLASIGLEVTGNATSNDTGLVNVTIDSLAAINFTTALLNFGNGTVNESEAIINSESSVVGGTWDPVSGALVLENIGNTNVSLELITNKTAQDFIGGSGSTPLVRAKVTQIGEPGSCTGGTNTFTSYAEINTTLQSVCDEFGYNSTTDQIEIEFELTIPSDTTGAKTVGVVAVGTY